MNSWLINCDHDYIMLVVTIMLIMVKFDGLVSIRNNC